MCIRDSGDFVAIMGPSGSGKSTLMNLIGCLDTPSEGVYECDGVDVSTLNREELAILRRDKIGFVFQGFNLLPRMSALDNVAMPLGYAQVPNADRRQLAQDALESVSYTHLDVYKRQSWARAPRRRSASCPERREGTVVAHALSTNGVGMR